MAACPRAWARKLLPTPGGPNSSTSRCWRMNWPVPRSKIWLRLMEGLKAPIKILQRFEVAKAGGLLAPFQKPLLAHVQFVLQEQFQELNVRQLMGAGFL